jgi:hypothetical protein
MAGEDISWQQKGIEVVQRMSNFESFKRAFSGALHLRFRDGVIIKIDLHARNAEEFIVALSERTDISFD